MIIWILEHLPIKKWHSENGGDQAEILAEAEARMQNVDRIVRQQKRDSAIAKRRVERLSVQGAIAGDYTQELNTK